MNELLLFYYGSHPDHRGRLLAEIIRQDDAWWEQAHDFIQWVFPLNELSRASMNAPLVDPRTLDAFRSGELLRQHMRAAVGRMLAFLGLRFDGFTLATAASWPHRKSVWFTESGHNSLRITRMLKSMSLLGLHDDALKLHAGLQVLCDSQPDCGITAESRKHWRDAVK